ncbi:hypothetical protein E3Q08_01871 [Wallemia mellicola]|uniref:Hydrophobin n=1 Tax=Wallemia mellicola TaxID=1708541 RepID=A0AB38MXV1_9BASI|nr:hypothetical protein E3Q24_01497 [Wallemia mellicola]TIB89831.1 hypothetical protein E3Q20_01534 [Wallemia mellicola]TIC06179.1 hypothetical protein E3Q16_01397 [Wallemia mellicola]TIC36108.1 hypothetical protein E3Q09_01675 [Wallemia mellicola]TIC44637.1 hypothetical protein E3Q08_01871 [Wallemia mellicola]
MVNTFQIASIAAVAATAFAYKSEKYEVGSCNTGKIHCCSTDKDVQESTGKNDALISTGDVISQLSLNCDQVPLLIGVAIEDECKNTPSRAQHENGLKHKGNKDKFIRNIYKRSQQDQKDRAFEERELRRLEGIGGAASSKETATGLKSSANKPPTNKRVTTNRDPYANYSTAKSLGYEDVPVTQEPTTAQQEAIVGGWEEVVIAPAVHKRPPSPPPNVEKGPDLNSVRGAPTSDIYIPGDNKNKEDKTEIKFKKRRVKK